MKIEKFWYPFGRAVIGFGFSSELWHIERKNGGIFISFFHFGYTPDLNPTVRFKASLVCLTLLWITFRFGFVEFGRSTLTGDSYDNI
ncbi:TPA: hypothetical protein ACISY6_002222 [Salmonella enterica subsp. enterica serovar Eastbourne]